jgi:hypothetical protein
LKETPQRWFVAFSDARKTPIPAQSASASPRTSASVLPGERAVAELRPDHAELAERGIDDPLLEVRVTLEKPSTVVRTSSSGKIAKKP